MRLSLLARPFWFASLCLVAGLLQAATPNCSLRTLMTPEEFSKAGLEKLSTEELHFLEVRLFGAKPEAAAPVQASTGDVSHSPAAVVQAPAQETRDPLVIEAAAQLAKLPKGEAAFGKEQHLADEVIKIQRVPSEITSRISGTFLGWSGKTRFVLENGQEWIQIESGTFSVNLKDPVVHIRKGMMGVFYFGVEGYGSRVKVKRLK